MGTLIVWENLDINRYVLKNSSTGEIVIKHLNKEQEGNQSNFRDSPTSAELEVQEKMPLSGLPTSTKNLDARWNL